MSIMYNPAATRQSTRIFGRSFLFASFFKGRTAFSFLFFFIQPCVIISGTNYVRFCFYRSCSFLTRVFVSILSARWRLCETMSSWTSITSLSFSLLLHRLVRFRKVGQCTCVIKIFPIRVRVFTTQGRLHHLAKFQPIISTAPHTLWSILNNCFFY